MSYSIDLTQKKTGPCRCPTCGNEHVGTVDSIVFDANHTRNTSGIWQEVGVDLREFRNKPATELAAALVPAIVRIKRDPDAFRRFEPGNGWGTVESTLEFLEEVCAACCEYPDSTVDVVF